MKGIEQEAAKQVTSEGIQQTLRRERAQAEEMEREALEETLRRKRAQAEEMEREAREETLRREKAQATEMEREAREEKLRRERAQEEERQSPANRDPTWDEEWTWKVRTMASYESASVVKNRHQRTSIMVDEIDDERGKTAKTWSPITRADPSRETWGGRLHRTTEEVASRQMHRAAERKDDKKLNRKDNKTYAQRAVVPEKPRAKHIGVQTEELTAAERAVIARHEGKPEALPIEQATDEEIADFCTQHNVRLAVPPGLYDNAKTYPKAWVVQCVRRTGKRGKKGKQSIVGIDTLYVGYTGEKSHVLAEHDPLKREKLIQQFLHVSRQPSTQKNEVTIRELIAKGRPEARMLHDLLERNYQQFAGRVKSNKRKGPKDGSEGQSQNDAEIGEGHTPRENEEGPDTEGTSNAQDAREPSVPEPEHENVGTGPDAPEPEDHPDESTWKLRDGTAAQKLLGRRVTKELKKKGGKGSRGIFHGIIEKMTWQKLLTDPIVFWCKFDNERNYVRYGQEDIMLILDDESESQKEGNAWDENLDGTSEGTSASAPEASEGQENGTTREMSCQTDDILTPNATWYTRESTQWGETVERKYKNDAELEHTRFGHPAADKMAALQKTREENPEKDLGIRWLNANEEIHGGGKCTCCLKNKGGVRRKIGSKDRRHKAKEYLERVHMDESGMLQVMSYGGAKYYTVFIDEFTRWKWTYVHERKTDIYDILQRFLLDAQTGTSKVKTIRFDQSSEHLADDYRAFLLLKGIKVEAACTESHYQNGIAEKAVRDIAETSRCMMNAEKHTMPRDVWGWAVRYATHVQNRMPHMALHSTAKRRAVSPHFMRFGEEADMSYIKPFGCEAFVHRDRKSNYVQDPKLDEHAIRGMFMGRAEDGGDLKGIAVKGDIIWTLEGGPRVIISDQTTMIETRFPQLLGPIEWEATVGTGRKVSADFEENNDTKGADGTPFYVTKEEAQHLGEGERMLDSVIRRKSDNARGIILRKDETAGLYKVYFLKNANDWKGRTSVGVEGKYNKLTMRRAQLNDETEYVLEGYDPSWRRGIIFKENAENKKKYANMSPEEKVIEKTRRDGSKRAVIMKAKSGEAPISSRIYEPKTYKQAMACEDRELWQSSIKKELEGLMCMGVLEVVKRTRARTIDSKYVFKIKYNPDGSVDKYKSRMVLRGDRQVAGRDYDVNKIFAPVANQTLARTMFSLAASLDLEMTMVDVRQAYLYADLEEKHLVVQPAPGITEILGVPADSWFKVKKSQYGLKQSGYNWFREFGGWIKGQGFTRCSEDDCLFAREHEVNGKTHIIMILQYVDDLLIFGDSKKEVTKFKAQIEKKYAIEDKGDASFYLGVEIERDRQNKTLSIHQGKYIQDMLDGIEGTRKVREHDTPMAPGKRLLQNEGPRVDQLFYQSCIGTLLYLSGWTRPDISFSVSELSKHVINPGVEHHEALMHLVGYVKRTMSLKITYGREPREGIKFGINELGGYVDASFAGNQDTRKSKSGFVMFMNGGPVSWKAKDQSIVALSTTDSEIDAAVRVIREVKGIRAQLFGLNLEQRRPTILYEDNAATICISHSASLRETTKHLGYRRGFLRDEVEKKEIVLLPIPTSLQTADIFTKALSKILNARHCAQLYAQHPDNV